MSRRIALVALAALAAALPAAAAVPVVPSGSAIGEGLPLKAYASVTPTVHLFGDAVTARLAVVADTKWVDPARLRVRTDFSPYVETRPPNVLRLRSGRFEQVTWTWTLRCLTAKCVPVAPPSEQFHIFRFQRAQITYLDRRGSPAYGLQASWPPVEVLSQMSPGVAAFLLKTNHINWRYRLAPLAAPDYRVSPTLLFWLALAAAGALLLGALVALQRWYFVLRPRRAPAVAAPRNALERALALVAWAHAHGDETLQRKALERVADELAVAGDLTRTARELAWSEGVPADEEVEEFAEHVRGVAAEEEPPA